jgi:hypothetical protein
MTKGYLYIYRRERKHVLAARQFSPYYTNQILLHRMSLLINSYTISKTSVVIYIIIPQLLIDYPTLSIDVSHAYFEPTKIIIATINLRKILPSLEYHNQILLQETSSIMINLIRFFSETLSNL